MHLFLHQSYKYECMLAWVHVYTHAEVFTQKTCIIYKENASLIFSPVEYESKNGMLVKCVCLSGGE